MRLMLFGGVLIQRLELPLATLSYAGLGAYGLNYLHGA